MSNPLYKVGQNIEFTQRRNRSYTKKEGSIIEIINLGLIYYYRVYSKFGPVTVYESEIFKNIKKTERRKKTMFK